MRFQRLTRLLGVYNFAAGNSTEGGETITAASIATPTESQGEVISSELSLIVPAKTSKKKSKKTTTKRSTTEESIAEKTTPKASTEATTTAQHASTAKTTRKAKTSQKPATPAKTKGISNYSTAKASTAVQSPGITASTDIFAGSTAEIETSTAPEKPQSITLGSQIIAYSTLIIPTTISSVATSIPVVVIGTQTAPIGQTITINSIPIGIQTSNGQTQAVVGASSIQTIVLSATPTGTEKTPIPIVIGSQTYTQNSASQYIVSGQTLVPGTGITLGTGISTTVISLTTNSAGAPAMVIGSSTSLLSAAPSQVVISGQTLAAGETITVGSGTSKNVYELTTDVRGSSLLVIGGTKTEPLTSAMATSGGIGGYIMSGLGGGPSVTSSDIVLFDQTLSEGGSITVGTGTSALIYVLTTNDAGSSIIVMGGTKTEPLASFTVMATATESPLIISDQTLLPGHSITIGSGTKTTIYELTTNSAGSSAIIIGGTKTEPLSAFTATASNSPLVISGQTLYPGQSITVGTGTETTVLALTTNRAGQTVEIIGGTRTETLKTSTKTSKIGTKSTGTKTTKITKTSTTSTDTGATPTTTTSKDSIAKVTRSPGGVAVAVLIGAVFVL
ncbi:MAG: hypothetical protein M1834_004757 [Cirrosporium novae-zelandiae]|nr:MAG: hypothetical protein M1834_004757 [Cirrosporium novae-zelandiae]